MLFLCCEGCQTKGVFEVDAKEIFDKLGELAPLELKPEDGLIKMVCDLCEGRGYHRKVYQTTESLRRMSVLRMLDLVYVEYKDKVRTKRLMDLFQIAAFPEDELEMTTLAKELSAKKEQKSSEQ